MKVVIAPNAFKDSITAVAAAEIIEQAVLKVCPDCETVMVPVADGGDGLVDISLHSLKGKKVTVTVRDPLSRSISAEFCHLPDK